MNKTKPTLVKRQALLCSESFRAGKFRRVGADFLEQLEADVDAQIRRLTADPDRLVDTALVEPIGKLYTPEAEEKLLAAFNRLIAALVHQRVRRHPSLGRTLKG